MVGILHFGNVGIRLVAHDHAYRRADQGLHTIVVCVSAIPQTTVDVPRHSKGRADLIFLLPRRALPHGVLAFEQMEARLRRRAQLS